MLYGEVSLFTLTHYKSLEHFYGVVFVSAPPYDGGAAMKRDGSIRPSICLCFF